MKEHLRKQIIVQRVNYSHLFYLKSILFYLIKKVPVMMHGEIFMILYLILQDAYEYIGMAMGML